MNKCFETGNCIIMCHNNNSWLAVHVVESLVNLYHLTLTKTKYSQGCTGNLN